ncbi:hypothetical protein DAEQUDRAFT_725232 [Daedalea quercina L-15889]|uniref:Uncharacterized protein n=1 Tax=Daedalea quercina L-15889 TaxID=1314783 RepID=A0A165RFE3_9APHY|nr:hypothetical protein DAEQUDRAFT_725232 [Daedalea quercina L-15889]
MGTSSALKCPSASSTTARTGSASRPERQVASTATPRRVSRLSRLFSFRTTKNSRKALANRTSTASITAAVPTMTDASATTSDASTDLSNTDWAAGFVSVMQYRRLEQDTEDIRRKIAAKKRENAELLCCIAEQNQCEWIESSRRHASTIGADEHR